MTAPVPLPSGVHAGVDIVDVARIQRAVRRSPRFVERVFTPTEVAAARRDGVALDGPVGAGRLAARLAAKEATRKARGGPTRWREIEVRSAPDGAPQLWIRGVRADASVSLAHDGGYAVAFVVTVERESD